MLASGEQASLACKHPDGHQPIRPEHGGFYGYRRQDPAQSQELSGKVKESAGDATDNPDLEAEGQAEQSGANVKQAGDNVADALRDASKAVKGD